MAATALGLADKTASITTSQANPAGCYYTESSTTEKLWFNKGTNKQDNDVTRVSICHKDTRVDDSKCDATLMPATQKGS